MRVLVLGSAAGGGCPQWNCACVRCARARSAGPTSWRTQDSLAIEGASGRWYLFNVSPDVRTQLLSAKEFIPGPGPRETPLAAALLTSAELDHTIGLAILREGASFDVYATSPVLDALTLGFPLRPMLAPYGHDDRWHTMPVDVPLPLDDHLMVTAIPVSDKRPRYAAASPAGAWVVAYLVDDVSSGGRLLYAPNVGAWTAQLDDAARSASCVIVDGTFFTDNELADAGGGTKTATDMGHLPLKGGGGMLEILAAYGGKRRIITHLNNTNPVVDESSDERRLVVEHGIEVASDGLCFSL